MTAEISSITAELAQVRRDIDQLERQLLDAPRVKEDLENAIAAEQNLAVTSSTVQEKTTQLQKLSTDLSQYAVAAAEVDHVKSEIDSWGTDIQRMLERPMDAYTADGALLMNLKPQIDAARAHLQAAIKELEVVWESVEKYGNELSTTRISLETAARNVRQEVEALQAGAGQIMRKGQEVRERHAKIASLNALMEAKKQVPEYWFRSERRARSA
ncbi:hypothetical protein AWV80_23460 [Cupriavidus sp. UYMU48A]|nr:hypothetical protein AWV80_23460 [Cupriavidus sp. UYMU48A]